VLAHTRGYTTWNFKSFKYQKLSNSWAIAR